MDLDKAAELKMARQLIGNLESKWDPEKYTDEYKENLMRVINAKVKGTRPKRIDEDRTPKQAVVVDFDGAFAGLPGGGEGREKGPGILAEGRGI